MGFQKPCGHAGDFLCKIVCGHSYRLTDKIEQALSGSRVRKNGRVTRQVFDCSCDKKGKSRTSHLEFQEREISPLSNMMTASRGMKTRYERKHRVFAAVCALALSSQVFSAGFFAEETRPPISHVEAALVVVDSDGKEITCSPSDPESSRLTA